MRGATNGNVAAVARNLGMAQAIWKHPPEHVGVLLARDTASGTAVGVAAMRMQPSLWSSAQEAYLADLYLIPSQRGRGYGRELITEAMRAARERNATYAFLITSEDDERAQRLYDAASFRRT
jgi:ribosomal protein S18 acetylase RimI-like enzyme